MDTIQVNNEIIMDIIKTIGIEIRFTITHFIKKEGKFFSTRCLFNEVYFPSNRTTIYVKII